MRQREEERIAGRGGQQRGRNNLEFKVDTSKRDIGRRCRRRCKKPLPATLRTYRHAVRCVGHDRSQAGRRGSGWTGTGTPGRWKPGHSRRRLLRTGSEASGRGREEVAAKPNEKSKPEEARARRVESQTSTVKPCLIALASTAANHALSALVLAQAEPAAAEKPAESSGDKEAATNEPAAKPADAEAKPADEKPAATPKPEEKPTAAATETPGAGSEAAGTMVGGTRVDLTFPQEMSYTPLQKWCRRRSRR